MTALERLLEVLAERGHSARAVPVRHLEALRQDLEPRISPELRELYLPDGFDFDLARRDPGLRAVVIVATPSPQVRLTFRHGGRAVQARMGPSYVDRHAILDRVKAIAAEVLAPAGHRTAPVVLPKKLLAARSGLGRYGRNNLLFVPPMGSFHRLTAFATDAPVADGARWEEPGQLERCGSCTACLRLCPTGAIGEDRFLLRPERCLTFFNEKPIPAPAWTQAAVQECLVGCLRCQDRCPENRQHRGRFEDVPAFSEAETDALLAATSAEGLSPSLREKLAALELLRYLPVLPRNLRALLADRPGEAPAGAA